MSKALEDLENIPLNRWYPYGNRVAFPFNMIDLKFGRDGDRKTPIVQYAVKGSSCEITLEHSGTKEFATVVRSSIPKAIERAKRYLDVSIQNEFPVSTQQDFKQKISQLQSLQNDNTPLPIRTIEDELSFEVVVEPKFKDGKDLWGYIDKLTGGCCNTKYHHPKGLEFYEGAWTYKDFIEMINKDALLNVVAVSHNGGDCSALLQDQTHRLMNQYLRVKDWREAHRATCDEWTSPRVVKLAEALSIARPHPDIILESSSYLDRANNVYPSYQADTVEFSVQYKDKGVENSLSWLANVKGTFTPQGKLLFITVTDSIRGRSFEISLPKPQKQVEKTGNNQLSC